MRIGQERQPHKQYKTTQIGKQAQEQRVTPHSEINMKEGGKRDSNQIKSKNEANRHREKHREGLAAEK